MSELLHSEVTIETLPPVIVASYKAISAEPETEGSAFLQAWLEKRGLADPKPRQFGFDIEVPPEDAQAGKRGYELWAVVPEDTQPGDGVTILSFPGGTFASMTLLRPFENEPYLQIPGGWDFLHRWQMDSAEYQGAEGYYLEEMIEHPGGGDLRLYHPVCPRASA